MRTPTDPEYIHEKLGEKNFASALSAYDTARRVQVLIEGFLTDDMVKDKMVLDVGCGLGFFSKRLKERGADVTACDIGPHLLEHTRRTVGCHCELADALQLIDYFGPNRFDIVVSSECIEHTPNPAEALRQMIGILKPGGFLSVSTPNILWYPLVGLATLCRIRPFEGYENFSSWKGIRNTLESNHIRIVREYGLHLFPFQFRLHKVLTWCDSHLQLLRAVMINICILGQKKF